MFGIHSMYSGIGIVSQSNGCSGLFLLFLFRNSVNRTHPKIGRKGVFKTLFQAFITQPPFVIVPMQFTHLTVIHFNTALRLQGELKAACSFGL